jgi:hypothetical protein
MLTWVYIKRESFKKSSVMWKMNEKAISGKTTVPKKKEATPHQGERP